MDDPGWAWPAWKFGMKRDDLFTKLHDQYNTVPSAIQDPEAFHLDVFELSNEAASADEFHSLMADRKEQRLRELNNSLESAAVEIIANPHLIGTAQWQHAVQLFRTKSLDSLVRYFASYLPDDHPWHRSDESTAASDASESVAHSLESSFDDKAVMTDEPLSLPTDVSSCLPPSPRSMTMYSDSHPDTLVDVVHHKYLLDTLTPARTLSFSESEPDHYGKDSCPQLHDDASSLSSGPETPVSSVPDMSDTHDFVFITAAEKRHEGYPSQLPSDVMESETPTPKPEAPATCFFGAKFSPLSSSLRTRSVSPSRVHPLVRATHNDCRKSRRSRQREPSPVGRGHRRNLGEPAHRVRKLLPDSTRSRPRGRRRADSS